MTRLLLDSSVWLAAVDPEDRFHASAAAIVARVRSGASIMALDLTLYEVANVLVHRQRLSADAMQVVDLIEVSTSTVLDVDHDLIARAVAVATEHGISVYDAAYAAAAERSGATLVSADIRDLVSRGLAVDPDAAASGAF